MERNLRHIKLTKQMNKIFVFLGFKSNKANFDRLKDGKPFDEIKHIIEQDKTEFNKIWSKKKQSHHGVIKV